MIYKYIILGFVVISIITGSYLKGYDNGSNSVQALWDKEKLETNAKIQLLKDEYSEQEKKYTAQTHDLVAQIHKQEQKHKIAIATLNASFNDRLQQSEQRAKVYQRMSKTSSGGCKNLGDYTARFDKQLTEGIDLVRELTEIIELRDNQLKSLNKQLKIMEKSNE